MTKLFVARSVALARWANDVGVSKHVYKLGAAAEVSAKSIAAACWGGESDWKLVRAEPAGGLSEEEAIDRAARRVKMLDPTHYPALKGATGMFRVRPVDVENHIAVSRALAGEEPRPEATLKPAEFAAYLLRQALR